MIDQVTIRGFKRFADATFNLAGKNLVLAGPNNAGKTTALQAISAWSYGLHRWRLTRGNDLNRRNGWTKAPITRQQFYPVSVAKLESLWHQRRTQDGKVFTIDVMAGGQKIGIEFHYDTTEQLFVRPTDATTPDAIRANRVQTVFVPPMSGLAIDEPEYKPAKLEQLLGQNRPGEVLRNLLLLAAADDDVWRSLVLDVEQLFRVRLLPPDGSGADIVANYQHLGGESVMFDVASGGSGFQQVVMLLTFLGTRRGSVLLLDEPDAHLHVFLQERMHQRLYEAARRHGSQLVIATHSEEIINRSKPEEVFVVLDRPVPLVDPVHGHADRLKVLKGALRWLGNTDLMKANMSPGVLYLEGSSDLLLLRAWARVLEHPALAFLEPSPFWRPEKFAQIDESEAIPGEKGVYCQDHFKALRLAIPGYRGLLIKDRDEEAPVHGITGSSPPTVKWRRREIESYLVHPVALDRFVKQRVGVGPASSQHREDLATYFTDNFPPAFLKNPHAEGLAVDLRESLLSALLQAAHLHGLEKRDYHEIAAVMTLAEVHPEVVEKLDAICTAFGIPLPPPPDAGGKP